VLVGPNVTHEAPPPRDTHDGSTLHDVLVHQRRRDVIAVEKLIDVFHAALHVGGRAAEESLHVERVFDFAEALFDDAAIRCCAGCE
jgi:hypothetical protein